MSDTKCDRCGDDGGLPRMTLVCLRCYNEAAAENAQLRQQLEEVREQAQHYMDLGLAVDADRADLRARLQTAERELATEKAKSEAFATVAAEAKERIDVVEGERDAALKAGRVLVAANTRHFNEAREACEALQAAQRELGVLLAVLERVKDISDGQCEFCECRTHEAILENIGMVVVTALAERARETPNGNE